MAIRKAELIYNGDTVTYHRITELQTDMATGACCATLRSWSSEEDRRAGELHKISRVFNFNWTSESMIEDAYNSILSLPHWADAESV